MGCGWLFPGFLFTCALCCFSFNGVAALTWFAWLFGFMMIMMTGVDTAFSACCAGVTCYHES
jgi:hypothetical protein